MISQLKGMVMHKNTDSVILVVGGIGLTIHAPQHVLTEAKEHEEFFLWTHLAVRENALELYGFTSKEELDFFEMLTQVSGIGPKSGIAILNLASVEQLTKAVGAGDTTYLTKVSGIGKKTAAKIVFELKDKLGAREEGVGAGMLKEEADALEALLALGYGAKDARDALGKIENKELGMSERIKEALKLLAS